MASDSQTEKIDLNSDPTKDPRVASATIRLTEDPQIIGIWMDELQTFVVGLLEDRVDFQTFENFEDKQDYFHRVLSYARSAERIVLLGPDETKKELCMHIHRDKDLQHKLVAVTESGPLSKPKLITAVRKLADEAFQDGTNIASDKIRHNLLE